MIVDRDAGDEDASPLAPSGPGPAAGWFAIAARRVANAMACRLGGPVYLVGSALAEERPADYDVRVVLAEADLLRLFGKRKIRGDEFDWTEHDVRRGREQLKQSRRLSRLLRCNVDVQIQDARDVAHYDGRPRLRLDTIPDAVFAAGLGDA